MVGIEAMAHGRPVVAFDVGGVREWLAEGVTGSGAPLGDTGALATGVRRLITQPGLAARLGEAGRALVDARFRRSVHLAGLLPALAAAREHWIEEERSRVLRRLRWGMGAIA